MQANAALKRWLSAVVTLAVFAVIIIVVANNRTSPVQGDEAKKKEQATNDWPLFGGTLQRNFVNTREKGIPDKWDVDDKQSVRWSADLGSKAYGGPIVSGGKVFVGTNNA